MCSIDIAETDGRACLDRMDKLAVGDEIERRGIVSCEPPSRNKRCGNVPDGMMMARCGQHRSGIEVSFCDRDKIKGRARGLRAT